MAYIEFSKLKIEGQSSDGKISITGLVKYQETNSRKSELLFGRLPETKFKFTGNFSLMNSQPIAGILALQYPENYNFPRILNYNGEFKDGQMHGNGTLTFTNSDQDLLLKYEGEFENNIRKGRGILTYPNQIKYEGKFLDNQLEGEGKITYPDGRVFKGIFSAGINYGGEMMCMDGKCYQGEINQDFNLDGEVKIKNPDGTIKNCIFKNGQEVLGIATTTVSALLGSTRSLPR